MNIDEVIDEVINTIDIKAQELIKLNVGKKLVLEMIRNTGRFTLENEYYEFMPKIHELYEKYDKI